MIDTSLVLTVGLIFLVTLVGAYVRSRATDRCLRSFEEFHITLERASGKLIWGIMKLEPTGMEFSYLSEIQDEKHIESSYLLYASEYSDIQALYRYADKLSEWGKRHRDKDIKRAFHPGPMRRLARSLRNFLATATDSLNEALSLLLGRVQKSGGRYLADGGNVAISKLSGKVLGQVGSVYDPLLERYIGQRVVVEVLEGNEVHEHVGILKEYSTDFIEVLDISYPQRQTLALKGDEAVASGDISIATTQERLTASNLGERPLLLHSLNVGEHEQLLNVVVDAGETVDLHPTDRLEGAKLNIQVIRELDMILPRARCVVRHRADFYKPETLSQAVFDIIFDVGRAFSADSRRDTRETRLREELAHDPNDALAAANLAGFLILKEEFVEAERLLRVALGMENSLPDGGRRARMQLRELERRQADQTGVVI